MVWAESGAAPRGKKKASAKAKAKKGMAILTWVTRVLLLGAMARDVKGVSKRNPDFNTAPAVRGGKWALQPSIRANIKNVFLDRDFTLALVDEEIVSAVS
jgi:hypothetical protein